VWAARAAALYRDYQADAIVIEVNQGGEMVETVLREADPGLAIVSVRAMRGKMLRAEPVALLYGSNACAMPEPFRNWKTRCVILDRMQTDGACHRDAHPIGLMHWSGR
jgi:phage terminase large subunit-like protein